MELTVRIIRPSSREQVNLLPSRIDALESMGINVKYTEVDPDPQWSYAAAPIQTRATILTEALTESGVDFIFAARGGYGASDTLPFIDWDKLAKAKEKILIGFSDISALHSALYQKLSWRSIHGPMPATALWNKNTSLDVDELTNLMRSIKSGQNVSGSMPIESISPPPTFIPKTVTGKIFGGCFTVLTNLIGTPYFPKNLSGHIVFIEDTDEHPARLMRAFNQWIQSGVLNGVQALVIGFLKSLGEKVPDNAPYVLEQFALRLPQVPIFHTPLIGHCSPNFPLPIGVQASINSGILSWNWENHTWKTIRPSIS